MRVRLTIAFLAFAVTVGRCPGPRAFAFVSAKGIDHIAVIDLAAREVVRFLPSGAAPDGIGISPLRPTEVPSR